MYGSTIDRQSSVVPSLVTPVPGLVVDLLDSDRILRVFSFDVNKRTKGKWYWAGREHIFRSERPQESSLVRR